MSEFENILDELDPLYEAMMKERRIFDDMERVLTETAKKLIDEHYPEIYHLSAEGYLELEEVISRHCCGLALDIANVINAHTEKDC